MCYNSLDAPAANCEVRVVPPWQFKKPNKQTNKHKKQKQLQANNNKNDNKNNLQLGIKQSKHHIAAQQTTTTTTTTTANNHNKQHKTQQRSTVPCASSRTWRQAVPCVPKAHSKCPGQRGRTKHKQEETTNNNNNNNT